MIRHGWLNSCCPLLLILLLPGCRWNSSAGSTDLVLGKTSVDAVKVEPQRLPLVTTGEDRVSKQARERNVDMTDVIPVSYVQDRGEEDAASKPGKSNNDEVDALEKLPEPPAAQKLPATLQDGRATSDEASRSTLQLQDVVVSVSETYPPLAAAVLERQIADGKQLSTWGAFDLGIKAYGIAAPEGFYENYRSRVLLTQPTLNGGYVYGGYKIGDGLIQPWFGERETNEGGEFSAGFGLPLLKNRVIDKRRAKLLMARFSRLGVEPMIRAQLLEFVRMASVTYWKWVAAGQSLEAQRQLLKLAEARVAQIEERVKAGDLSRIADINNQQLIAARETKVIEAERKLQAAAIKLSLFVRDADGVPQVPDNAQLPGSFPRDAAPDSEQLQGDILRAVDARPEMAGLELLAEKVRVELAEAQNNMLPKLDAGLLASKDVGAPASSKGDKTPFELELGLYGEVPVQRRNARGRIEAAQGKLAQIDTKRQFVVNKVTTLVQDAYSAMTAAAGRIERAQKNLELARETLELAKEQFNAGDIDLVELNIYEQSATDAQLALIAAQADFFSAMADYRAAMSADPMELIPEP